MGKASRSANASPEAGDASSRVQPEDPRPSKHRFAFPTSGPGLYKLDPAASRTAVIDQLAARLSQLEAMLHVAAFEDPKGTGFRSLRNGDRIEYMCACRMMSSECKELVGLL